MERSRAPVEGHVLWVKVCDPHDLELDVGVCALVHGRQVALFMTGEGAFHAVGNRDPFSGTQSMSHGIVGRIDGNPYVASPQGREVFDLVSGSSRTDPGVRLPVYPVRLLNGYVEVCVRARP